jgi:preprotein translocase subunit SecY
MLSTQQLLPLLLIYVVIAMAVVYIASTEARLPVVQYSTMTSAAAAKVRDVVVGGGGGGS